MLTSKFFTASLTALTIVGTAGLVYAQTTTTPMPTPTPDATVEAQPGTQPPITGDSNLNRDPATQGTGTLNQDRSTMSQGTDTTNQDRSTLTQGSGTVNQDGSMDDRLVARADRN